FAVSMVSLAVATTRHPPQMVQKDYYALDLNYQAHLDKRQNTAALSAPPTLRFDGAAQMIRVIFPEGMRVQNGTAKCYRSVTTRDDILIKIEDATTLNIPTEKFAAGRWHVELDWTADDGKPYFWETTLSL
ncbi:MAG: FixH family protein, partial [Phycisphaerae bacterium]|nr:FixH family protein [Saprospiraceae bacterium]